MNKFSKFNLASFKRIMVHCFMQSVLERVVWPATEDEDYEEEECSLEGKCRVAGYLSLLQQVFCYWFSLMFILR